MEWGGKNSSPFTGTADSCYLMGGGANSACLMDGGSANAIKKQGMFHNLSHNSSELSPDSSTLLARDHLAKMKFSTAAPSTAPQHHLSLYFPSCFMLVSSSLLNPVRFPPQIESQRPVDSGGTRDGARRSANRPTYYGVVTSLLAPPFISPTAAPN